MSSRCAMWALLRDNSSPSVAIPSLFSRTCLDHLISSWEWHCYCQGPLQLPFIDWISPPVLSRQWAHVIFFCGSSPYVQLRFAILYRIGQLPTPALVLRVLCEKLAIVSWTIWELRGYRLGLRPLLHFFLIKPFPPNILIAFFFLWPSATAKDPE